jgi:hypothetical protein
MLPKRDELSKILKDAKIKKEKEAEEQRIKDEEARIRKEKEDDEKFNAEVKHRIERIEEDILYAIKQGKNETELRFGDGRTKEPAWERAVARLQKTNKDYTFKIQSISVHCDNHSEAYNVDGVSPREWWESLWELKVSW